jgi:hypothetical protein
MHALIEFRARAIFKYLLLVVFAIPLLLAVQRVVFAKLPSLPLQELYDISHVVVRARISTDGGLRNGGSIRFDVLHVSKGSSHVKDNEVFLCRKPPQTEAYDPSQIKTEVVLFLKVEDNCLIQAHGVLSVYPVENGFVNTAHIFGEPEQQKIKHFESKLKKLARKRG